MTLLKSKKCSRIKNNKAGFMKFMLTFSILILSAFYSRATIYQIPNWSNSDINRHSVCKNVAVSNSGAAGGVMVPTGNSTEWSSFRAAPPASVSMCECGTGGACLYLENGCTYSYYGASPGWCGATNLCYLGRYIVYQTGPTYDICDSVGSFGTCYDNDAVWFVCCNSFYDGIKACNGDCNTTGC